MTDPRATAELQGPEYHHQLCFYGGMSTRLIPMSDLRCTCPRKPATAASDARFCVCGAERGHYGSERCKPKPTLTDDTLPPFCEVHGCRGRWDDVCADQRGGEMTEPATAAPVEPERVRAVVRLLLDSGDITPMGASLIERALPDAEM